MWYPLTQELTEPSSIKFYIWWNGRIQNQKVWSSVPFARIGSRWRRTRYTIQHHKRLIHKVWKQLYSILKPSQKKWCCASDIFCVWSGLFLGGLFCFVFMWRLSCWECAFNFYVWDQRNKKDAVYLDCSLMVWKMHRPNQGNNLWSTKSKYIRIAKRLCFHWYWPTGWKIFWLVRVSFP